MRTFAHEAVHEVRLAPGGDERALGGAITVELCGHWEHEGPCRWPHHTAVERGDSALAVRTSFDAPPQEADDVRARIRRALSRGELRGPDGDLTRWSLLEPSSG